MTCDRPSRPGISGPRRSDSPNRGGVYEMSVSYNGRDYKEGKKIGWKDGVQALYCILRHAIAD
jgi:hypothetical protein